MIRNIQTGRSMIEMLGVLAIIGVLSAGGIMGYSSAMENYKVNKFMEMVAMSEAQKEIVFAEMPKETGTFDHYADEICDLHIIPDEICNKESEMGEDYRIGYFGENIKPFVRQYTISAPYTTINLLSGERVTIHSPISSMVFVIHSQMPVSACVKILSNQGWQKIGLFSMIGGVPSGAGNHELPLAISQAVTVCNTAMSYKGENARFSLIAYTIITSE